MDTDHLPADRFDPSAVLLLYTGPKGEITTASISFQKATAFDEAELIGQTTAALRHADVPQVIYRIIWDAVARGEPVGAYLKNRTRDGQAFWVFAIVTPHNGGTISMQMRPQAEVLDAVRVMYADLKARETAAPDDEAGAEAALLRHLNAQNVPDYTAFVGYALSREMRARDRAAGRKTPPTMKMFRGIYDATHEIRRHARAVEDVFRSTRQIPFNMRLQASRLEGTGGPISVISDNHKRISEAIDTSLARFGTAADLGSTQISQAAFSTAVADLAIERAAMIEIDPHRHLPKAKQALIDLRVLAEQYYVRMNSTMGDLMANVGQLAVECRQIRRVTAGLEMTRMMCKIEHQRFRDGAEGLEKIICTLEEADERLNAALSEIEPAVQDILRLAEKLVRERAAA